MFRGRSAALKSAAANIVPGLGPARTDVEEPADLGPLQEMQGHGHRIFDIDEIPQLLAVPVVRTVGFEKAHQALVAHLGIGLVDDTAHIALVVFVGAEDVEILQPPRCSSASRCAGPSDRRDVWNSRTCSAGAIHPASLHRRHSPGRRRHRSRRWEA